MRLHPNLLITCFIFFVFTTGCNKSDNQVGGGAGQPGSEYTAGIAGVKVWNGTEQESYLKGAYPPYTQFDTSFTISNDTAAITVINDTLISVFSNTLPLSSYNPNGNTITFSVNNYIQYSPAVYTSNTISITYNYATNNISYSYNYFAILPNYPTTTINLSTP